MKMVSAAKMKKAQDRVLATRPYANKLNNLMEQLISLVDISGHPLTKEREIKKKVVVLVTSDKGLCGSFNSNIIKFTANYLETEGKDIPLVTIGRKGYDFFSKRRYNVIKNFPNVFQKLNIQTSNDIVTYLKDLYLSGEADRIELIFNEFKSIIRQNIVKDVFLPYKKDNSSNSKLIKKKFIYEPDSRNILEELIPKNLNIHMWKALLESNASEQGARMTAMDAASNNAGDLIQSLNLNYNRARQESITKELLEIVGGAEALRNG
jgi:F-type H+-transporting ATPase subunit gamma